MNWNKMSNQLGSIKTDPATVGNVINNFIKNNNGEPQLVQGTDGLNHLLIHGSNPETSNGKVYFYIGQGKFKENPPGYVSQDDLYEWMNSKGYGGAKVVACYSGLMNSGNVVSEFQNPGQIELSTSENSDTLNFSS